MAFLEVEIPEDNQGCRKPQARLLLRCPLVRPARQVDAREWRPVLLLLKDVSHDHLCSWLAAVFLSKDFFI